LGGGLHQEVAYRLTDTIQILQNIVVPQPKDRPTLFAKESVAAPVRFGFRMLAAIGFDDETLRDASKIGDVAWNWVLTAKGDA
jgi:hypothetical protein